MRGTRHIWGERASVRSVFYMTTLAAIRRNEIIRQFYKRLVANGKLRKVAMVACMRRLSVIINTVESGAFPRRKNT